MAIIQNRNHDIDFLGKAVHCDIIAYHRIITISSFPLIKKTTSLSRTPPPRANRSRVPRPRADYHIEKLHGAPKITIAGIDEAGRGALAGPVIASAVILDSHDIPANIDDSKKLTPKKRGEIAQNIIKRAHVGLGMASVEEIDRLNILQASLKAMKRALDDLPKKPDLVLIDGNHIPKDLSIAAHAVIGGDGLSLSIAAASIIAKTNRDDMMDALARDFPFYGWERNKGYGTQHHLDALEKKGLTRHHRLSFRTLPSNSKWQ